MTAMSDLQVRKYSATDEMNGRINPAMSLGSESDEDVEARELASRLPAAALDTPTKQPILAGDSRNASLKSQPPAPPLVGIPADKQTAF